MSRHFTATELAQDAERTLDAREAAGLPRHVTDGSVLDAIARTVAVAIVRSKAPITRARQLRRDGTGSHRPAPVPPHEERTEDHHHGHPPT